MIMIMITIMTTITITITITISAPMMIGIINTFLTSAFQHFKIRLVSDINFLLLFFKNLYVIGSVNRYSDKLYLLWKLSLFVLPANSRIFFSKWKNP